MRKWILFSGLVLSMLLSACTDTEDDMEETRDHGSESGIETMSNLSEDTDKLEITMYNKDKEKVGTATFRSVYTGLNVTLDASNLPPGTHGFHIHENGICEAPDFESAGSHYNSTDAKHGFDHSEGPHAGDLPNIEVDQDGNVVADVTADMVTLKKGQENSLLKQGGTALVIHSEADDYKSQPSGDAGNRIACGVISE
ncbi:superoxide dismutase, Cu-Zn family [Lentibacillus halodurans]|uniref:Superoxide dismutase [Cu-Zn] n=1 Tax=Lentibacillus halodurans TaxID=237679 RepID=A0A1I0X5X9_9BACI|nr:superoxide dismutase family protein [Lentibacillus halodurans]SFA96472.1 superoxide dismutase, Cu-Zn family [Lentibacillus halodurans]